MRSRARLLERKDHAGDVLTVRFSRPSGYSYRAGQWCFLVLPEAGFQDDRGLRRHLSFTSSPEEATLAFATKRSDSAFKQTLAQLEPGQEIELEDPKGRLALPDGSSTPICFLAGGIGITPFRSLAVHSTRAATGHDICLLYSSRTPEEALFLDEFRQLEKENPRFRCVPTMTRMHQSNTQWDGREGRPTAAMIREAFPPWAKGAFYIAGPPRMMQAMQDLLDELEVPKQRVTAESFTGYSG